MAGFGLVEYANASPEVKALFDEIKTARNTDDVVNFWKALANNPDVARRTWETMKQVLGPGALDPVTKELIYIAVAISTGCDYCVAVHSGAVRRKGATDEQMAEFMAIVGLASSNAALAKGFRIPLDSPSK